MTDKRTEKRKKDNNYRLDGNLYQKYRYRQKSIEKMGKELTSNGIKPIVKSDVHKTYEAVRKQWQEFRQEIQDEKYDGRLVKQNKINRERYEVDKSYRDHKRKSATIQHVEHVEYVEKLEKENQKLRKDLNVR